VFATRRPAPAELGGGPESGTRASAYRLELALKAISHAVGQVAERHPANRPGPGRSMPDRIWLDTRPGVHGEFTSFGMGHKKPRLKCTNNGARYWD
jgi:hypothetical protein